MVQVKKIIENPHDMLIYIGKNDITNGVNLINSVKKIVKLVCDICPQTTVVSSSIIVSNDKKNVEKPLTNKNTRLKNYCHQREVSLLKKNHILVKRISP